MLNRFVVIAPFANQEKNIEQFLASLYYQTYTRICGGKVCVIMVDDCSADFSKRETDLFCNKNNIPMFNVENDPIALNNSFCGTPAFDFYNTINNFKKSESNFKVLYIRNYQKLFEVANILEALKYCEDQDIIVRADCDDFISDLYAFSDVDKLFQTTGCDFLYSQHRWTGTEQIKKYQGVFNTFTVEPYQISKPLPENYDAYKTEWSTSHLRFFRKYLLNDVKDENYRRSDGEYGKRAGDQFVALAALHNAKNPVFFPKCLYSYNIKVEPNTFSSDDAKYQRDEAVELRQRGFIK